MKFIRICPGGDFMGVEKAEEHIKRMEKLRNGGVIPCPYCGKGKIRKKNDAAFLCDTCGKGIVGRVNINI